MDNLTAAAASGMRSRMQALDILANNLANSSSRGYKSDREISTMYTPPDAYSPKTGDNQQEPWVNGSWTNFSQGVLETTGSQLDLALQGPGFLTVRGPSGNLYTRNGTLSLSTTGELLGPENRAVLDKQNRIVKLDPSKAFTISPTGELKQEEATIAQLNIVEFANPAALVKMGQAYFSAPANTQPVAAKATDVRQGLVESSNTVPAESAVRLVTVLRQFEMLQKAISVGSEMNRRAMEEVAKITP